MACPLVTQFYLCLFFSYWFVVVVCFAVFLHFLPVRNIVTSAPVRTPTPCLHAHPLHIGPPRASQPLMTPFHLCLRFFLLVCCCCFFCFFGALFTRVKYRRPCPCEHSHVLFVCLPITYHPNTHIPTIHGRACTARAGVCVLLVCMFLFLSMCTYHRSCSGVFAYVLGVYLCVLIIFSS